MGSNRKTPPTASDNGSTPPITSVYAGGVPAGKPAQAPAPTAVSPEMAAILARLEALEQANKSLASENAALKAGKAPKPEVLETNASHKYDPKTGKLTVVLDCAGDILGDDGLPKVSSTGATTGVAFLQGTFKSPDGREFKLTCNAYRKVPGYVKPKRA